MSPKNIVQLNFLFMAFVIVVMVMMNLKKGELPEGLNLLMGFDRPAPTVIKATRGQ